jgi:hypothetical protein
MSRPVKMLVAALAAVLATAAPALGAAGGSPQRTLAHAKRAWSRGGVELTPLLRQLAIDLPELSGSQRRQAQSLLARPTDGPSDPQENGYSAPEAPGSPACAAHFCVHWTATGPDAPALTDANGNGVPDFVEVVLSTSEHVYDVENVQLGWRPPKSDGTLGGSGLTDVYLKQLGGRGLYGYAAPDPAQRPTDADHSVYAYLVLDNDYSHDDFPQYASPLTPLDVTLAHEYNHVLQFGYDFFQDTWMLEATATWMEGKVYPEAFDYLQYLPAWTRFTTQPITTFNSLDQSDAHNLKVYAASLWNKWLDGRYGQEVIRGAWEDSLATDPPSFAVKAYDRSIRGHGGPGFGAEFDRFAAATAEWREPDSGFPDGSRYPDVPRAATVSVGGRGSTRKLNHTTYALLGVRPSSAARVRLGVAAPAGTSAAVAIVGRTGSSTGGSTLVALRHLPHGGAGTVTVTRPSRFTRLTAVLVNSDTQVKKNKATASGDFIFVRDSQPFYSRISTDVTRPRVKLASPRAGAGAGRRPRVRVAFSEAVRGVDASSLELIAPNGRAVKARVSFRSGSRSATITPRGSLAAGRRYRVRVTPGVTDTTVNPLARTVSFAFSTAR